jgi:hypothetical protein
MQHISEPPVILDSTRVLLYAESGGSAAYTGSVTISTGSNDDRRDLGPVERLAICEDLATARILVMHCDPLWNVSAAHFAPTIDAAKAIAERAYSGVSSRWTAYRQLTAAELAELHNQREVMRQLTRDYPLQGHDPDVA